MANKPICSILILSLIVESILTHGSVSQLGETILRFTDFTRPYPAWGRKIADDMYKIAGRGDRIIAKLTDIGVLLRDGASLPLQSPSLTAEIREFADSLSCVLDEMVNITVPSRLIVNTFYAYADELEGRSSYSYLYNYFKK